MASASARPDKRDHDGLPNRTTCATSPHGTVHRTRKQSLLCHLTARHSVHLTRQPGSRHAPVPAPRHAPRRCRVVAAAQAIPRPIPTGAGAASTPVQPTRTGRGARSFPPSRVPLCSAGRVTSPSLANYQPGSLSSSLPRFPGRGRVLLLPCLLRRAAVSLPFPSLIVCFCTRRRLLAAIRIRVAPRLESRVGRGRRPDSGPDRRRSGGP